MRHIKSRFLLLVVGALASAFSATAFAHEAKLIKLTGSVQVQLPGQPAQPGTVGMAIPQGTVIKTQGNSEAFIEAFNGAVATVGSNSELAVEKLNIDMQGDKIVTQEAMLDLRRGNVVSTIDPTKKAINKYSIRTPKGVAAARGTVFGVNLDNLGGGSVKALTGTVTFTSTLGTFTLPVGGGEPLFLPFNAAPGSEPMKLSDAIKADSSGAIAAEVVAAVKVVADNVAASTSATGGTAPGASDTATAIMTAVAKAAANAVPSQVSAIAQVAISAVSSSSSQTGGSTTAVNAITEALVSANPSQAAAITQSASAALVQTKVADAVAAAKAGTGPKDDATLARIAQEATTAAKATVQSLAQTAVNTAVAATVTSGTPEEKAAAAASIASSVSEAATTGSQDGSTTATTDAGVPTATAPTVVITAPAPTEVPTSTPVVTPVVNPPLITPVDPRTISNGAGNG